MSYSEKGFKIPEYGEEADIPSLVRENVEILEKLLDNMGGLGRIYSGDTEPEADTYTWFAPYDPTQEIIVEGQLNLGAYTGDESKLHIEVTETGELFTAENTTVTTDGDNATVIIQ